MKLKNLLYATMVACAFASCSKEDVNVQGPTTGTEEGEPATLSLKVATPTTTRSGALDAGVDNAVNSLVVYVFNGEGNNAKLQTTAVAGTNGTAASDNLALESIKVSAGTKQIVVVANADVITLTANETITDFYGKQQNFEKEFVTAADVTSANFSMNSKTYTVSIKPNVVNYMGYESDKKEGNDLGVSTVYLYRNVAKICLNSVALNTNGAENVYSDAKFQITDIFLLHAAKDTKIVGGAAAWSATNVVSTFLNGVQNDIYGAWAGLMADWLAAGDGRAPKKMYITTEEDADPTYGYNVAFAKGTDAHMGDQIVDGGKVQKLDGQKVLPLDYFYAYESFGQDASTDVNTMLVVKGIFTYGDSETGNVVTVADRYYPISVGIDNVATSSTVPEGATSRTVNGVLRNLQYNIDLTVKGPGYETPFGPDGSDGEGGKTTILDVKVQVAEFGQVSQNVPVE